MFALLGLYGTLMCPAVGKIDEPQISIRLIWGATCRVDWDEVEIVKALPSHLAFRGNGKWLTTPLQGVQNHDLMLDLVQE